jgi:crotonobetainyl-CoA:carnitine CoA-transferase CaiB-like acyl-CoA transferase
VAARVLELVGLHQREELRTSQGRAANRDEVDAAVAAYVGERTADEVIEAFVAADAAIAPVLHMKDIVRDEHVVERGILVDVDGDGVLQQAPVARLSKTPGRIRWSGRPLGADTKAVLAELDARDQDRK